VNPDGRVTAVAAGIAIVSAAVDGRTAQAAVTVRARPRGGTTWVSDFEITITVESSGRRQASDQRLFAVFEPGAGGTLAVTSLEMRLARPSSQCGQRPRSIPTVKS